MIDRVRRRVARGKLGGAREFLERELGLRNLALQNVCKRCQQKIVWRFQMGKYKAKKPGTRGRCNKCEQKSVRMAYRSLCDACGKAHDLCPGCQHPPSEANASRDVPEAQIPTLNRNQRPTARNLSRRQANA